MTHIVKLFMHQAENLQQTLFWPFYSPDLLSAPPKSPRIATFPALPPNNGIFPPPKKTATPCAPLNKKTGHDGFHIT